MPECFSQLNINVVILSIYPPVSIFPQLSRELVQPPPQVTPSYLKTLAQQLLQ